MAGEQENTGIATTSEQAIPYQQWSAHIPPDLKDKGYWEPVKEQPLSTVLKNYGHAQERMGKAIVLPDKPDDVDGWGKVYTKLGRPDKATDYKYDLPDGIKWDKDTFQAMNEVLHKNGASQSLVSELVTWFTKDVQTKQAKHMDAVKTQAATVKTKLTTEYGSQAETKFALARRAAETYFGEELGGVYVEQNMDNETIVRGLVKLGSQLAEDGVFGKKVLEEEGVISREKAQTKINEIMSNRSHPYWGNPANPATQDALKEVEDLHKIAYPE